MRSMTQNENDLIELVLAFHGKGNELEEAVNTDTQNELDLIEEINELELGIDQAVARVKSERAGRKL